MFLVGLPFLIATLTFKEWPFGQTMCKIYVSDDLFAVITTSLTLCATALHLDDHNIDKPIHIVSTAHSHECGQIRRCVYVFDSHHSLMMFLAFYRRKYLAAIARCLQHAYTATRTTSALTLAKTQLVCLCRIDLSPHLYVCLSLCLYIGACFSMKIRIS